jgi:hypothetical protein
MKIDHRDKEHRYAYFDKLYELNLTHGVMPGLVYLYMPELAQRYEWDAEQRLWFAFLNGLTQNPVTSLRLFSQLPQVPPPGAALTRFSDWFNREWETLQFDTDRRHQKKDTVDAIKAYAVAVNHFGCQADMLRSGTPYSDLWARVRGMYKSFGRLSAFSYLEYVHLNGFGADCNDLMFDDKEGSRSHRNGMLFLLGHDDLVWDKRADNGFTGTYANFEKMCSYLDEAAHDFLVGFEEAHPGLASNMFTLESNLCTFKNHFFGRRYPGVYADMAWERIEWADTRGQSEHTEVFKDIRSERLPEWLRMECEPKSLSVFGTAHRAAQFAQSGWPFRGEHFL